MRQVENIKNLLQQAGIPPEAMAHHLASKGIGTPDAWNRVFANGDASSFTKQDASNASSWAEANPQLVQQVQSMLSH